MRALAITKHCTPKDYQLLTLPVPKIQADDDILIKVKAAGVNPIDVKMADTFVPSPSPFYLITNLTIVKQNGQIHVQINVLLLPPLAKILPLTQTSYPWKIGHDLSGTIISLGPAVKNLKIGDEVFAILPESHRGSIAEYALSTASTTALKPKSLSFVEAASLPIAGTAAAQAFERAEREMGEGALRGKTVFVPAGLSGTGSMGKLFLKVGWFLVDGSLVSLSSFIVSHLLRQLPEDHESRESSDEHGVFLVNQY
jgi:NADPH:quinone reductase-like Zn-dependent oxidoreductase